MKLAVIVSDATAMVHTGAELHRVVRVFDLPPEVSAYIAKANEGSYATISLALVDDPADQVTP